MDPLTGQVIKGESRWPMAIAVVVLMAFALASSSQLAIFPPWVLAGIEGVLLLGAAVRRPRSHRSADALAAPDHDRAHRSSSSSARSDRRPSSIYNLLTNTRRSPTSPVPLLVAGAKVWLGNNVAFAFLYWGFDGGGPAARAHGMPRYPDLAFPQQTSPDLAPPGWRPQFIDYLYVGFTTANAFSPTDTMPMVPVGQDRHGLAGAHLVRDRRPDHRPRGQPVPVGRPARTARPRAATSRLRDHAPATEPNPCRSCGRAAPRTPALLA